MMVKWTWLTGGSADTELQDGKNREEYGKNINVLKTGNYSRGIVTVFSIMRKG